MRRLYNQGAKVFITGSNAKMLSREMGTHLSGIHLPIELYPFSFAEYLQLREIQVDKADFYTTQGTARLVRELKSYMQTGGFPAYLLGEPDEYISSLYQSIIYKDVLMRNNISNGREVLELMHFLASNVAKRHSYMSLARVVGVKHSDTIKNYVQCLEETYLLSQLMKYSPSVKSQEGSIKKMYLIDNAIVKVIGFNPTDNIGPLLENMVFIELKRRGREVFYHDGAKECDFIVREGIHIVQCIQVSVSLADERTHKREVDGLLDAARTYGTTDNLIITLDGVVEVELSHIKAQGVDDYCTGGNRERVVAGLGDLFGEVNQHVIAHLIHLGMIGRSGLVVPQRRLAAFGDFADVLREGDGEVLEALYHTLGRIDGDLLIERVGGAADVEPERQGKKYLPVDGERVLGDIQVIVARCSAAFIKVDQYCHAVAAPAHLSFKQGSTSLL